MTTQHHHKHHDGKIPADQAINRLVGIYERTLREYPNVLLYRMVGKSEYPIAVGRSVRKSVEAAAAKYGVSNLHVRHF